jgi:hypothetical protein
MSVEIGQLDMDVTAEAQHPLPEAAGSTAYAGDDLAKMRNAYAQMMRDRARTRAEGYDD